MYIRCTLGGCRVYTYRASSMKYSQSPSAFAMSPFMCFHLSPRWLFCCGSACSFFIRVPDNARNIASYVSGLAWLGTNVQECLQDDCFAECLGRVLSFLFMCFPHDCIADVVAGSFSVCVLLSLHLSPAWSLFVAEWFYSGPACMSLPLDSYQACRITLRRDDLQFEGT